MHNLSAQLMMLAPELALLLLACGLLVVDSASRDEERRASYWFSQFSLLVVIGLLVAGFPEARERIWDGHFVSDALGSVLKIAMAGITVLVLFYANHYLCEHRMVRGEYYVLGLFAVLGMMVMASAGSMLTAYLGLELLSLSLYSMVAMHRDSARASEAAIKYFVLGALASGMLLYGISMLYGVSGVVDLAALSAHIASAPEGDVMLVFGLAFVVVGVAFKLGAVPFHMWVPDVYEGSPTAVTMFIASAPKIAAFALAIRLLVDGMAPLVAEWQGMLAVLAVLSMAAGNIIAISQTNIKRMLAYSTIAHIGFLLLGIVAGSQAGYAGAMFYVMIYALMSMGAFGVVILLGRHKHDADQLDDFKGLSRRSAWFAFIMLVLMFSMAGVPPFAGFWAKWVVIKEIVAVGHPWLAVLAVLFSVIGAYYYLRIVKLMYFDDPDHMRALKAPVEMRMVLSLNGLSILLLGLMPGTVISLCLRTMGA